MKQSLPLLQSNLCFGIKRPHVVFNGLISRVALREFKKSKNSVTRVQQLRRSPSNPDIWNNRLGLKLSALEAVTEAQPDTGRAKSQTYKLPDGVQLEVLFSEPKVRTSEKPPMVFIHGSGRAAWCWKEFMEYFAALGFDCFALSLRGQGNGDRVPGSKGNTVVGTAEDIACFISSLKTAPIVVAHSFGGLVMQRYLQEAGEEERFPVLKGLALLCSAPPSGNSDLIKRLFAKSWTDALRLTWAFVTKSYIRSPAEAQWAFLAPDSPPKTVEWFAGRLKEFDSSIPVIDVRVLNKEVPLTAKPASPTPILVVGGDRDIVVDVEGVRETADFFGVEAVILPGAAHDVMLDVRWEVAAKVLADWIQTLPL